MDVRSGELRELSGGQGGLTTGNSAELQVGAMAASEPTELAH